MNILWIIVIGFVAGVIARFLAPGPNNPQGFILTTILGIVGAFLATFIGQTVGWYRLDQGAGLIGAAVGALIVLFFLDRPGGQPAGSRSGFAAASGRWAVVLSRRAHAARARRIAALEQTRPRFGRRDKLEVDQRRQTWDC